MGERVAAVRRFNRFYTRRLGVLNESMLGSPYSLAQMRVLWEIGSDDGTCASWLEQRLGMDAGYVSRILRNFREQGFIRASPAACDARIRELRLTERGRRAVGTLDARSAEEVRGTLSKLPVGAQERVVASMRVIEEALTADRDASWPYLVRTPRAGDFGWVVSRHGEVYAREFGWDATFEAFVAELVARFIREFKPGREQGWIAEREGERVGSVFVVERSEQVAQLRMLLVDPSARGHGIGDMLVRECIRFARGVGYRRMMLSTYSILAAARKLYERAGFRRTGYEVHERFGYRLAAQTWQLTL